MKATKKLLAILLAATMLLALIPSAFATEPISSYTLTINNTTEGHTYVVYQVFTGELSGVQGAYVLSNVKYGTSWNGKAGSVEENVLTAYEHRSAAENIEAFFTECTQPAIYRQNVASANGSTQIVVDQPGYYIVKEVSTTVPEGEGYTKAIVQVVGDTTIDVKSGTASSQKKVKDKDDSDGTVTDWQDTADYDLGDDVPFQLSATVSPNFSQCEKAYQLTFHDVQSAGLSFNNDVVVRIGGEVVDASYYTVTTNTDDGCTFHVHFDNLKTVATVNNNKVVNGSVITVEYTSKLNNQAVIGSAGNSNKSHITFTNKYNSNQPEEDGKTPDDEVIVYTFKLVVNKVTANNGEGAETNPTKPLAGAEFTLYKWDSATDAYVEYRAYEGKTDNDKLTATEFQWLRLDAGKYKLVETTTPGGFNTIEPIEFMVAATHSNDPAKLELVSLTGEKISGNATFATTVADGSVATTVINVAGNTLPSTGGMGTTIFYVLGSILAIGAAILLISKKRMNGVE